MSNIVKLGYENPDLDTVTYVYSENTNYNQMGIETIYRLVVTKEALKDIKNAHVIFYPVAYLKEPFDFSKIIHYDEDITKKVAPFNEKELHNYILKNRMLGILNNVNDIITEKEFDIELGQLLPQLIESTKKRFFKLKVGLRVYLLTDGRVVINDAMSAKYKLIGTLKSDKFEELITLLYRYFVKRELKGRLISLQESDFSDCQKIHVRQ